MFHPKLKSKGKCIKLTIDEVKKRIKTGITDAKMQVIDTNGSGDHFSAVIISNQFEGLSRIKQHQMVYKTVSDVLTRELHALQLKTYTTSEWEKINSGN